MSMTKLCRATINGRNDVGRVIKKAYGTVNVGNVYVGDNNDIVRVIHMHHHHGFDVSSDLDKVSVVLESLKTNKLTIMALKSFIRKSGLKDFDYKYNNIIHTDIRPVMRTYRLEMKRCGKKPDVPYIAELRAFVRKILADNKVPRIALHLSDDLCVSEACWTDAYKAGIVHKISEALDVPVTLSDVVLDYQGSFINVYIVRDVLHGEKLW